ncbi:hypothetical protein OAT25_04805 [Candidatus Pelagibacter sp.]|nr:hypothetical protein [Candidatus Pelagibacter sp.]
MKENINLSNLLCKISLKIDLSQKHLARDLEFSLGILNYYLKLLNEKGLSKIKHLKKNKINYV